jgi:hypothetical protein
MTRSLDHPRRRSTTLRRGTQVLGLEDGHGALNSQNRAMVQLSDSLFGVRLLFHESDECSLNLAARRGLLASMIRGRDTLERA